MAWRRVRTGVAAVGRRLARLFEGRPRTTAVTLLVLAVGVWTAGLTIAWFAFDVALRLPRSAQIREIGDMARATTLFDIEGRPAFRIFREQRIEIPLARMSPHLVRGVVAVEDQRFYQHRGIDVIRVGAAVVANVRSGRKAQGGSTITQQLARLSFLSRDKTFRRKLKEILLAASIEQRFSKDEILEMYLNKVYLGDGFYGVEAAALGYFGKHAQDLTLAEAALVAGLIQSPSAYAPSSHLGRAVARRTVVLAAMRDTGVIDDATFEAARQAPVELRNGLEQLEGFGLYFKEMVRRELVDRFGWERVSEGGLNVYTTIDTRLQPRVEAIVESALAALESRRGYSHPSRASMLPLEGDDVPDYLQAAVVVLDPASGEVRALVGGRNFAESRFNRAAQAKRQAGSAFKPFVYAAALEQGLSPASLIAGLDDQVLTAQGEWMPEDEHSSADAMSLRSALRTSSNRAAVRLLQTVGMEHAMQFVRAFDFTEVPAVPSMALGAGEVTLTGMTSAYAAFVTGGVIRTPVLIRRVEDRDGQVLAQANNAPRRVVSEQTAFLLASMLTDVINAGTAWKARAAGFTLPAGGKTGTTNDYRDVWFVGFTPHLVTGVWVGFDQPKPIIANGYAGELAVPLWAQVMKAATEGHEPDWLPRPDGLVGIQVCRVSGKLPAEGCSAVEVMRSSGDLEVRSMVYTEYFPSGTAPAEICDLHPTPAWFAPAAEVFVAGSDRPVLENELALPPAPAAPLLPAPAAHPEALSPAPHVTAGDGGAPAPARKPGFWSRVFGKREPAKPKPGTPKGQR
jgi:penicillin-binding protein 1A